VTKDIGNAKLLSAVFALVSIGKACSPASQFFMSRSKYLGRTCDPWWRMAELSTTSPGYTQIHGTGWKAFKGAERVS